MSVISKFASGVIFASVAVAGAMGSAEAAPIVAGSTINFAGQSTCNSTACTFGNALVTSGTGSFSSFTFGTAATFFPFTYDPFTPQQVYSTTNASGQTASFFTTEQLLRAAQTVGGLTSYAITDAGTAQLTGFDDTRGFFSFTANQNGSIQGSFSATANAVTGAVPEPATWAMMLIGVGAVGASVRRRKVKTTVAYA